MVLLQVFSDCIGGLQILQGSINVISAVIYGCHHEISNPSKIKRLQQWCSVKYEASILRANLLLLQTPVVNFVSGNLENLSNECEYAF
ncbi:hypothetical protein AVEN_262342-1 [Araneus ventricosus]|uniref:Uncharacterized protein n=1 Tax=Araneus ventricosus TaxID=182803 RepID=A0A4Y2D4F9_ARAVE|nr:hypothetical protein AVEN_88485-1 [Araneus ventricosus]GBM11286.1 hypothetical protein AVEN_262342-1 [Araneus ventricosus]